MSQPRGVLLLVADPDLGLTLSEADFEAARQRVVAPRVSLEPGLVELSQLTDHERLRGPLFGALVLEGALMTSVSLGGRESRQVLGRGDFVAPVEPQLPTLPGRVSLIAERSASVALLDDRFVAACVRWPGLFSQFCQRLNAQARAGLVRQAIVQLPRVEDRLLAMFWELSERWGRIEEAGMVVDLPLTHAELGFLVGARRPTISRGLKTLAEEGLLKHQGNSWTLAIDSRERLAGEPPPARAEPDDERVGGFTGDPGAPASLVRSLASAASGPSPGAVATPGGVGAATALRTPRGATIVLVGVDRRTGGRLAECRRVRFAAQAAEAVESLAEAPPAVVVVDLAAALRSGRTAWSALLTRLRTRPELADTRLVVIVERRIAAAAASGLKAAAHELLVKPVEPAELLRRVERQLTLVPGAQWWPDANPADRADSQRSAR